MTPRPQKSTPMKQPHSRRHRLSYLLWLGVLGMAASAAASAQHVHGLVRLDVTLDATTLRIELAAPLESLLGFEHRPRTPAQKQAGEAVLQKMNAVDALIRPQASALCQPTKTTVTSEALQAQAHQGGQHHAHADLNASFEFACERPQALGHIEIGFFEAFKRIQKIEAQMVSAKAQSKQTLKRPDKMLRLAQ
jgi:hypothetical protein